MDVAASNMCQPTRGFSALDDAVSNRILLATSWDAIQLKTRGFETRQVTWRCWPQHKTPFNSGHDGSRCAR